MLQASSVAASGLPHYAKILRTQNCSIISAAVKKMAQQLPPPYLTSYSFRRADGVVGGAGFYQSTRK